jgi:cyclohexadieny/prephenate dehydrogenase
VQGERARGDGEHFPDRQIVPAHPVAGTEYSGPDAGFATLFKGRWCILTPPGDADPAAVMRVSAFWERLGAQVEIMDAQAP